MKIMELYRRGKPIRATFYLVMGICSIGIAVMCLMDLLFIGVIFGLFFAYLNFSWLPSVHLKEFEKSTVEKENLEATKNSSTNIKTDNIKSDDKATSSSTVVVQANNNKYSYKGLVTVEELSDDYVKLIYKDYKYEYKIPQSTPKTLEALPVKDCGGDRPSKYAKEMMLEAFKDFKPKTREGDSRHIIKLDNYDRYDFNKNDNKYFQILDEKNVSKLPDDIKRNLVTYLRVKATRKYTKDTGDGTICCCIELGNLENTYIFEDEIRVSYEMYEAAEVGKEYIIIKYGLCSDNHFKIYESDFLD